MVAAYFSPLAPAAVLLLSAFVLSIIAPRWPAHWLEHRGIRYFLVPGLVGLALVTLFGVRLTFGQDSSGAGLVLLSGWNLSSAEAATALAIRAEALSLLFLIGTLLVLLVVALVASVQLFTADTRQEAVSQKKIWREVSGWFGLGASVCFLIVSANVPTLGYAVFAFDVLLMFYWFNRGRSELGIARLFLGVLTASALALAAIAPAAGIISGMLLLSLALWLRLGLYPFIEMTSHHRWKGDNCLIYLGLSLTVGLYLLVSVFTGPLPELVGWLVVITMIFNALLVWLSDHRPFLLVHLVITEALLLLFVAPLAQGAAAAYSLGIILSLIALWLTPQLGRPQLAQRTWFWPYLPALTATLTLIGFPLTLGWLARIAIYEALFLTENTILLLLVVLAELLALSGLFRYWVILWQGNERDEWRPAVGIVGMVPFLIPGLAPFVLSTLTRREMLATGFEPSISVLVMLAGVVIGAFVLGYFRQPVIEQLKISPLALKEVIELRWILPYIEKSRQQAGKSMLRIDIVLQGQHYIGWAIFAALVGTLIILLTT